MTSGATYPKPAIMVYIRAHSNENVVDMGSARGTILIGKNQFN